MGARRRRMRAVACVLGGVLLGLAIGVLCGVMFAGVGVIGGIGIGIAFAVSLGFAGLLYSRDLGA